MEFGFLNEYIDRREQARIKAAEEKQELERRERYQEWLRKNC